MIVNSWGQLSVATIESGAIPKVFGHVEVTALGKIRPSRRGRWNRGARSARRECMRRARRDRGRHICRAQRSACDCFDVGLRPSLPHVPMVQTAHSRQRTQLSAGWSGINCPAARSILAHPIVGAVRVVVSQVLAGQAPDMRFVQRDHLIEALAAPAARCNPSKACTATR